MIGDLPTTLEVNGKMLPIRSDYRVALNVLEAFADEELSDEEKGLVALQCIFVDEIKQEDFKEALNKIIWFFNCGNTIEQVRSSKPLYSWEQDEHIIFSAINKVAGKEIRAVEYMHFWTFIGLFNEIGESSFATVVSIRKKKQNNQKLEKWEKDFCKRNPEMVNLKRKYTKEEQDTLNKLDIILGVRKEEQCQTEE